MNAKQKQPSKDDLLQIRVTPDEKLAFAKAAELAGSSVSSWARVRLRRLARRELEDANFDVPFIKPRPEEGADGNA